MNLSSIRQTDFLFVCLFVYLFIYVPAPIVDDMLQQFDYLHHRRWKEVMFSSPFVYLFVRYLKKLWTDLDEIWYASSVRDTDELIRCWRRSGSGYWNF